MFIIIFGMYDSSTNQGFYNSLHLDPITRVVIKINGHRDKRSSKFSNLNSVNSKIAQTK